MELLRENGIGVGENSIKNLVLTRYMNEILKLFPSDCSNYNNLRLVTETLKPGIFTECTKSLPIALIVWTMREFAVDHLECFAYSANFI